MYLHALRHPRKRTMQCLPRLFQLTKAEILLREVSLLNLIRDINFNPDYLKAYETHEGGRIETFRYDCGFGEAFMHYVRRPLTGFEGFGGYCDLITPYGYGGQMVSRCEPGREAELLALFNSAFEAHCRSENAVSYFARFNPLAENGPAFRTFRPASAGA